LFVAGEPLMPGPLAGLRVLELARILAGPWAGQILADLGADVVKVERKGLGDDTRGWGPPFVPAAGGGHLGAAYFHGTNRGKRSIELDFESEDGKRIVKKLAARSDVVLENFKVGTLAKFGLDYESLARINPRLVYCSVTGFGQTGPYAARAGYDLMAQGIGGFMDLTGNPDDEPLRAGVPVSDLFTGVYAAVGVLAALARREKTGQGGYVDCALVDSTVGVLANQALNYLVSGKVPHRMGNAHPNITPYQVFPVSDGHIIIASGNDNQFVKLCGVLGAPELAPTFWKNSKPPACRPDRSTISERCSPIRKSSTGACASIRRAPRPRAERFPAYARRSCSTARRWRPSVRRRGSASTPPRFCARSARANPSFPVAPRCAGLDPALPRRLHSWPWSSG
jgi:crotonobetainyl-CoA:carnitine CoA-transferase CaiB-like acyl-CoA transferase